MFCYFKINNDFLKIKIKLKIFYKDFSNLIKSNNIIIKLIIKKK